MRCLLAINGSTDSQRALKKLVLLPVYLNCSWRPPNKSTLRYEREHQKVSSLLGFCVWWNTSHDLCTANKILSVLCLTGTEYDSSGVHPNFWIHRDRAWAVSDPNFRSCVLYISDLFEPSAGDPAVAVDQFPFSIPLPDLYKIDLDFAISFDRYLPNNPIFEEFTLAGWSFFPFRVRERFA